MRNIFLCFLTVMLFASDVNCASAASRSVAKSDTSVRVASPVRTGATRPAANRAEKTAVRDKDVKSRTAVTSNDARSTATASVVSRNTDKKHAGQNVRARNQSTNTPENNARSNNNTERNVANRAATGKNVSAQDVASAKELLEQTASLNKSCQEQYNECMDQFCAVVDTNQKRCSCSANLSKYSGVQEAVTNANNELNEVAQRIRYVGLSADEIHAIMSETEAEIELDNTKDKSETRNMLSQIEELIKDPTTKVNTTADMDFGLDLDLDFMDMDTDMFSLDFLNNTSDSISSKRGTALYNAAKKRCKTILNNCVDVGATSSQITGNYDLAIDKDCIAYEQGLKKMNETLQSNVRSAGVMLQKARLAVLQNKNQYDAKGCIGALESCMTDEMVCGSDYTKCLDPTKKYIDENGNVVLGQDITNITAFMQNFNNGAIDSTRLSTANGTSLNDCDDEGTCIIKHLLNKIGTGATVKDGGLCRAVLDKCQQYTYNASGNKYNPYNDVVVNYVQRAMVNIKSAQQRIISDYASNCMTDVASCYNQQVTQVNSWSSVASVASIKGIMTGACRNVALTCAYAVFENMCTISNSTMDWVLHATDNENVTASNSNVSCTPCNVSHQGQCIEGISEIFYQSLLCPENSTYNTTCAAAGIENRYIGGCVNKQCKCNSDYTTWNGTCVPMCNSGEWRDLSGSCQTCDPASSCETGGTYAELTDKVYTGAASTSGQERVNCPANSEYDYTCASASGNGGTCLQALCRCTSGKNVYNNACIEGVNNADYDETCTSADANRTKGGCAKASFRCKSGYTVWSGTCQSTCVSTKYRDSDGVCQTCAAPRVLQGGSSTLESNSCIVVPEHSISDLTCTGPSTDRTIGGCVAQDYRCDSGYVSFQGMCMAKCGTMTYRDSSGTCQSCSASDLLQGGDGTSLEYSSCITNAGYDANCTASDAARTKNGCAVRHYRCNSGYTVWAYTDSNTNMVIHSCRTTCSSAQYRNNSGVCKSCTISSDSLIGGTTTLEPYGCGATPGGSGDVGEDPVASGEVPPRDDP